MLADPKNSAQRSVNLYFAVNLNKSGLLSWSIRLPVRNFVLREFDDLPLQVSVAAVVLAVQFPLDALQEEATNLASRFEGFVRVLGP